MTAFVGLDGFVDDILHVVDKRESADKYLRLPTIAQLAERLAGAAGRSTNSNWSASSPSSAATAPSWPTPSPASA